MGYNVTDFIVWSGLPLKYILIAALLVWIVAAGYRFTACVVVNRLRPGGGNGAMERVDGYLLAGLVFVYALTAFLNLGSTKAPQTFYHFEPGSSVTLDLGEVCEISRIYYYTGLNTGSYDLWVSETGESFEKIETLDQNYAELFDWCSGKNDTTYTGRYLWLGTGNDLYLGEVIVLTVDGRMLSPVTSVYEGGWSLIDEGDTLPQTFDYLSGTYFDEIYHARTAYEHIVGMWPYEISHPPLGKVLMGLGIRLFGMTPFGWRCMGTLAGVLMLPLLYLLSKRMLKNTMGAFAATTLFAFDFMHFVQTRIATIDSYAVLFLIAMYYFMYRYVTEGHKRHLALSGLAFGLGAASKWTCIYAGMGLGVIWLLHWVLRLKREHAWKEFAKNIAFCLVFFCLVPGVVYYVSYYYYGVSQGMSGVGMFFRPEYAKIVWDNQISMLTYHVGVDATHPYSSRWYQWIFNIRPILYYLNYGAGTRGSIAAFVSPLVSWGGLLAMIGMGYLALFRKDTKAGFILVGYLAQLVPWMLVNRIQFAYHYFGCVVFLCLALGYGAAVLDRGGHRKWCWSMLGISVGLFALFYPVLSGGQVSNSYGDLLLKWMSSWPL